MADIEVTRPTQDELDDLGVKDWPIWTCDVSTFDWHYDRKETCLLLEGKVTVRARPADPAQPGEELASFGPGDFVVLPQGLDCTWEVTEPVRKHYRFG